VLRFEEQFGLISIAFLTLVIWFVATAYLGRSSRMYPERSVRMSLLGASYFGYPVWAFWLGRHLARLSASQIEHALTS
jgi:hypothetical protein